MDAVGCSELLKTGCIFLVPPYREMDGKTMVASLKSLALVVCGPSKMELKVGDGSIVGSSPAAEEDGHG